jgi:Haem-binding domain
MKILFGVIALLVVVFVLIQFVPVDRSNPPVESDIPTPPEVKAILKRACYDCHANDTVWP